VVVTCRLPKLLLQTGSRHRRSCKWRISAAKDGSRNLEPPPTVATIGGGSGFRAAAPAPAHAAGRISPPAGGAGSGVGLVLVLLRGAASTLLALSHAANSSASFMNR
jgi:hypothetical protein